MSRKPTSDGDPGTQGVAEMAEARAMFRSAAGRAVLILSDLRLCEMLKALEAPTIAQIDRREEALERLDRRAEALGLRADLETARTEVWNALSMERRYCAATDLRLSAELAAFDEAGRELEHRIERIAVELHGRSLPAGPLGWESERLRLRDCFKSSEGLSGLAAECMSRRVSGFADRQARQGVLEARADRLRARAGRIGAAWDIAVASADHKLTAVVARIEYGPQVHENALRNWEYQLDELESAIVRIEQAGGL